MPDPLDLHCVRVFREVARRNGFSRAAAVLS